MTCALTIFINFRLRLSNSTYLGDYDDFTPSWFKAIGYSLGLTFLLKMFAIILVFIFRVTFISLRRCRDRGWSCSGTSTRTTVQADYERLYINPEFDIDFSYTEIINVIFVAMTLSPLLPYIFYIAWLYLVVLYWKDKITFLMFSRKPPQFDESMSHKSRLILAVVIPVYLILCIWIFGNLSLLDETNNSYALRARDNVQNFTINYQGFFGPLVKFINRCTNGNAIVFTILLCLWVVYIVLKYVVGNLGWILLKLLCGCCKRDAHVIPKDTRVLYCWRVPPEYVEDERAFYKLDVEGLKSKDVKSLPISQKLQILRIKEYEDIERMRKENPGFARMLLFNTLPSYDYRMNPDIRDLFLANA